MESEEGQASKMRRRTPTLPTAHGCPLPQTEQTSDWFITWAARTILRHRSLLLSINTYRSAVQKEGARRDGQVTRRDAPSVEGNRLMIAKSKRYGSS